MWIRQSPALGAVCLQVLLVDDRASLSVYQLQKKELRKHRRRKRS
jgi:hypothetical protein